MTSTHGMLEKMARGMRFTKRAVRADLHRFKAIVELDEEAEGGWRGRSRGQGEATDRAPLEFLGKATPIAEQERLGHFVARTGRSRSKS